MIKATDFHRMWITVPDNLRTLLATGNVITCSHEQVQFVMAVDTEAAQADAARGQYADPRPVYMILPTRAFLSALADGETIKASVWSDTDTQIGSIRLTSAAQDDLRTEHGLRGVTGTVLSELRAGDFFAIAERNWNREWVVYRALRDAARGEVTAQYTSGRTDRPVDFAGANQVVYLVNDRAAMLRDLGWEDVPALAV